jgi:murein DD-endopeptidase MepM/ murein hydrolase activator NlpD
LASVTVLLAGLLTSACGPASDAASAGAEKAASAARDVSDKLADDGTYYYPLGGAVRDIGYQPGQRDHTGRDYYAIDLDSDQRTVYPARGGRVAFAGFNCQKAPGQEDCYGNTVAIDHGGGIYSIYTHLAQAPALKVGDKVRLSTQIGTVGDSGCPACGPHLHFVVRKGSEGLSGTTVLFGGADGPIDVRGQLQPR